MTLVPLLSVGLLVNHFCPIPNTPNLHTAGCVIEHVHCNLLSGGFVCFEPTVEYQGRADQDGYEYVNPLGVRLGKLLWLPGVSHST